MKCQIKQKIESPGQEKKKFNEQESSLVMVKDVKDLLNFSNQSLTSVNPDRWQN